MDFPEAVCFEDMLCEPLDEKVGVNLQRRIVDVHVWVWGWAIPELPFRFDTLDY